MMTSKRSWKSMKVPRKGGQKMRIRLPLRKDPDTTKTPTLPVSPSIKNQRFGMNFSKKGKKYKSALFIFIFFNDV